jgi:4-carboxymuconolactone decarboxylase
MSSEPDASPPIDPDRLERGARVFAEVSAGVVPVLPAGFLDFTDLMFAQLFAEQWSRPELPRRDRRLLTLAAVAAMGEAGAWAVHLEAALRNEELTVVEARECVIHLAQYVGYPRAPALARVTEEIIMRRASETDGEVDG